MLNKCAQLFAKRVLLLLADNANLGEYSECILELLICGCTCLLKLYCKNNSLIFIRSIYCIFMFKYCTLPSSKCLKQY